MPGSVKEGEVLALESPRWSHFSDLMYLQAVADAFTESGIDYAQLVKIYGNDSEGQKRYSPAQCLGTKKTLKSSALLMAV